MRKLKPILAVIVALSILLLSGCANIQALLTKSDSDFYEIKALSDIAELYCSVDISGDNILFLTASGLDPYVLSVYDVEKNSIVAQKDMADSTLEYISGAKFGDNDRILVYDEGNEKAITYDLSLNETGTIEYPYVDYHDNAPEASFFNDTFVYEESYAYSYEGDDYCLVLYDDLENVYIFDSTDESIYGVDGKKLLTVESTYTESNDTWNTKVNVKDIENSLCINSLNLGITSSGIFNDFYNSAISDKYVCFINRIYNDVTGGSITTPYLWKYTESPSNEAIDIKALNEEKMLEENEKIIDSIMEKYGVNVFINKEPQFGFSVDLTASTLQVHHVLTNLEECLDLFPENFVKEVYKDAEYVNGLNIHIVENIDGASAFANDFAENYEICFGCRGFSRSVVFHEFMHLIDNRIQTYYDDNNMDFYDLWWKLNPEDFEYGSETDYEPYEEHFISYYAMTNVGEDMADTFQAMFEAYENNGDERFSKYENVGKKAALICEAIRRAFPCMATSKEACWEKYIDLNK
ncbi:MAG: hypothetical protein J1E05_03125 [Eubacterium sp.]|nr:hypothetical protein [Eubacterium sp.]